MNFARSCSTIFFFLVAGCGERAPEIFSDPERIRPWTRTDSDRPDSNWDYFFEKQPQLPEPPLPEPFGPVRRTTPDEKTVILEFDQRDDGKGHDLPLEIVRAGPDLIAKLPGPDDRTVRISAVGLVWDGPANLAREGSDLPVDLLDPVTLQPLNTDELDGLGIAEYHRSVFLANLENSGPQMPVFFHADGLDDMEWIGLPLAFDRRTHVMAGTPSGGGGNLYRACTVSLYLRHDTPLRLFIDVGIDPVDVPLEMRAGSQVQLGNKVRVQLLTIEKGLKDGSTMLFPAKEEPGRKTLRFRRRDRTTTFVLEVDPPGYKTSLEVVATTSDGKTLSNWAVGGTISSAWEEIDSLSIRWFSRRYRLVFDLNEVPGFPNPRSEIENLFELKWENVTVRGDLNLRDRLLRATQLKWNPHTHWRAQFPPGFFPKTWESVTPREMFDTLRRHWKGDPLVIDAETCEIRNQRTD